MEHDPRNLISKIIKQCLNKAYPDILEIGCGDGRITRLLSPVAKTLVAIDPDDNNIGNVRNLIPDINFLTGTGEHLEFQDNSFDIVVFSHSLHHQNSFLALQEAERVLRETGRIIIMEPTFDGELDRLCQNFVDDMEQMKLARDAIESCELSVVQHEIFDTDLIFKDKDELYTELCNYYNTPVDNIIISRINSIIGEKQNNSPLKITDKILLVCLQK